jgi:DNA mismatch repair protein MutS
VQLTLFAPYDHPLLDKIRQLNVDQLTPLEALQAIQGWQEELAAEKLGSN